MSFWALSGLINGLVSSGFGLFVYLKNRKSPINRLWAVFSSTIVFWSFSYFFWQISTGRLLALFWCRSLMVGASFIPVTFFHFLLVWLKLYQNRKKTLLVCYGISVIAFVLNFTPLFVKDVRPISYFKFWPQAGIAFLPFLIFWAWVVLYCLYIMFQAMRMSSSIKRNQIKYVLLPAIIGFSGGFTNYPLWFGIKIPPYGNILVSVYVAIMGYAIVRHQLMDIEVVIKKSLVFAGMFAFVFGIVVTVAMLIAQLLGGANNLLALTISALIITFTLRPIETWLINTTDKFLFQKKHEYKEILKTFIDEVITVLNLDEIINSTLKLLDQTLHPYTASIFILNKAEDKYQLYNSYGLEDKDITFTPQSKLIALLKKTANPAVIKQIDGIVGVNPEIASEMVRLKAVAVLPLMLHNDLIGFISLGKKKSDEEYTKDDLDVLQDLARTESIAVGNAQLLTEAAQAERRAAIGTMAAGIHHEIGNPLNIINTKIQLFLTGVKRGFYQGKSKEKIIKECQNILGETINQTNRIADITRRLSNFAKPSKEFKPELVNISDEIDETLAVVGHDLELEKIKINKEISQDAFRILADKHEIQQIFFNIIRNAGQSIEGEGAITIRVLSTKDNKIRIEIEDTGKGIAEDKQHRIFEPFFTTKGPTKGTGLGLSIVRQLVWRNKGEISFRSQEGVGTTFILEFPRAKK